MKNIQEIINEMENLSEQVATTVVDDKPEIEPQVTPEEPEKQLSDLVGDPKASTPRLGTACCFVPVPGVFKLPRPITSDNKNIIYSTSNLTCFVKETTVSCSARGCPLSDFDMPAYEVRIVGCIPFIANVFPITGTDAAICDSKPGTARICCSNTLCVNKTIGVYPTEEKAMIVCNNTNLLTCENILASFDVTPVLQSFDCSTPFVKFSVTFTSQEGNCI